MTEKMKSFVKGILLGLCGHPLPQGEPVAYLYNGVRLPKLPEWDKEAYPYAYIDFHSIYMEDLNEYPAFQAPYVNCCYIFSEKPYVYYDPNHVSGHPIYHIQNKLPYLVTATDPITGEWREIVSATENPNRSADWANYDVTADDGTIIQAASEPVPVYE
jgi:hypothetical protein